MTDSTDLDKLEAELRSQLAAIQKARRDAKNWRNHPQLKDIANSISTFSTSNSVSIGAIKKALFKILPPEEKRTRAVRARADGPSMPQLRSMAKAKGLKMPNTAKLEDFKKALGL